MSRMKRRKKFGGKGNGTEGEGHRKEGGDERDVNDRDYWKINHVCQGKSSFGNKASICRRRGRKKGKARGWGQSK